jgi:hypothetical protein
MTKQPKLPQYMYACWRARSGWAFFTGDCPVKAAGKKLCARCKGKITVRLTRIPADKAVIAESIIEQDACIVDQT